MSLNYTPLPLEHVVDPIVDFSQGLKKFVVSVGGKHINWQTYDPVNNTTGGSSNVTFQVFPSYQSTGLCRNMFICATLQVTFKSSLSGSAYVANSFKELPFAPVDFPLNESIRTATIKLNGQTFSIQNNTLFSTLKHYYYDDESLRTYSSTTPNMRDTTLFFQKGSIGDPLSPINQTPTSNVLSRGSFPFRIVNISGSNATAQTNGSTTVNTTPATITVEYDLMECLTLLSPLSSNEKNGYDDLFLFGLNDLSLNLQLEQGTSLFNRIFNINDLKTASYVNQCVETYEGTTKTIANNLYTVMTRDGTLTVDPTSISAVLTNWKLQVGEYTPQSYTPIPDTLFYNYTNFNYTLDTNIKTNSRIQSRTITLGSLPEKLYLNISLNPDSNYLFNTATFDTTTLVPTATTTLIYPWELPKSSFGIDNVTIGLNNMTNMLVNWDKRILYHSNIRNGESYTPYSFMNLDTNDSSGYSTISGKNPLMFKVLGDTVIANGTLANTVVRRTNSEFLLGSCAPLCLDFGRQIALDPLFAPGLSESIKLSVQITASDPYQINYTDAQSGKIQLLTVYQQSGVITVTNGSVIVNEAPLTKQDVLNATEMEPAQYEPTSITGGGSWFSKLRKSISKGDKLLKHVIRNLPEYASKAEQIAEVVGHEGLKDAVKYGKKALPYIEAAAPLALAAGGRRGRGKGAMVAGAMVAGGARMSARQLADRL